MKKSQDYFNFKKITKAIGPEQAKLSVNASSISLNTEAAELIPKRYINPSDGSISFELSWEPEHLALRLFPVVPDEADSRLTYRFVSAGPGKRLARIMSDSLRAAKMMRGKYEYMLGTKYIFKFKGEEGVNNGTTQSDN